MKLSFKRRPPTMVDLLPAALERLPIVIAIADQVEAAGLVAEFEEKHGVNYPEQRDKWAQLPVIAARVNTLRATGKLHLLTEGKEAEEEGAWMLETLQAFDRCLPLWAPVLDQLGIRMPRPLKG